MSGVHEVERDVRNTDIAAAWTKDVANRDNSRQFCRPRCADLPLTYRKWTALTRVLFITGSATALWASVFLMIEAF